MEYSVSLLLLNEFFFSVKETFLPRCFSVRKEQGGAVGGWHTSLGLSSPATYGRCYAPISHILALALLKLGTMQHLLPDLWGTPLLWDLCHKHVPGVLDFPQG